MKKPSLNTMLRAMLMLPIVALLITACSDKPNEGPLKADELKGAVKVDPTCVTAINLLAGQTIEAGTINFYLVNSDAGGCTGDAIRIVVQTTGGWTLQAGSSIAVEFSNTPEGFPMSEGGIIPGQLEFQYPITSAMTYWTTDIPFTDLGVNICNLEYLGCFFGAIHVVVALGIPGEEGYQEETGWAEGYEAEGGNWSMYFEICRECLEEQGDDDPLYEWETAYAWDGQISECFIDHGFGNWGWTIGTLVPWEEDHIFPLHAGAGQCNLDNSTYVGNVFVHYWEGTATITYDLLEDYDPDGPFLLSEVHFYIGEEMFPVILVGKNKVPTPTVAPGRYTYVDEGFDPTGSRTFTISGLGAGPVYIIAHAVVGIPYFE
jgi:hypothetical protein